MLRAFTARYIPQFQFFKEFLDVTVVEVGYAPAAESSYFSIDFINLS